MSNGAGRFIFAGRTENFGVRRALVAYVELWRESPETNCGWILLADESVKSARRFNSREHDKAERRPRFEITYSGGTTGGPVSGSDCSGAWYDPTLDGEGHLIFQTPFGWVIYFFGYTKDNQRLRLISELVDVGDLVYGQAYIFNMLVGIPGSFGMPTPSDQLEVWGTLQMVLNTCTSG